MKPFRHTHLKGFTLTEVMIASAVGVVAIIAVMQMTISITRMNFDSVGKLGVNNDIRSFTGQLTAAARSTTDFRIYTSTTDLTERQSAESGDLLVLVWADPEPVDQAPPNQSQVFYIRRVIAFARTVEDTAKNTGPVIRIEQTFPAPNRAQNIGVRSSTTTIKAITEGMLSATSSNTSVKRTEVVELTRGLNNRRLFFYSGIGRSITVNGELYHGNRAREVTNTYNFTVSPRG